MAAEGLEERFDGTGPATEEAKRAHVEGLAEAKAAATEAAAGGGGGGGGG
eukprot:CAMPEP_0203829784 /NCGR_PEP_ID=MMETSP0115-20131106/64353_1 /ASSEMBLY_ACC=CAM_ASM_000227 /TAXON_ID=33651 /ORGANISM="Bicosoecid sp, Strain ms1" /LENGTH=49 /DNA_ID= /DNA_START= /DNA_END= /DNA_ORIENTATION=